jgi:prepilin-type N-terminal cleavage/methylation domain-containing protein
LRRGPRAGFTLIEALIALALAAVVVGKITMVLNSASRANTDEVAAMTLEDQARRVLDRVAFAIMGADRDVLFPDPQSPDFTTELDFQVSLGVEDGEVVWSDPEWVGLEGGGSQVVWKQNPEQPHERRVAWCNVVRPFLEGEIPNGVDDNGNGLIDEEGLSFTLNKNAVTIRLCLERPRKGKKPLSRTVETVVTIRN